ncbi:MAG: methionyl-tRNA formyltransferase [Cardiobacteriaceae bacterium]|nr:methionyl-tRNA formyltransferase [Cardiobacteriaceae bacterium]
MSTTKPRLWFSGTPEFAAVSLKVLCESDDYEVEYVLTQPDRPAGRGQKAQMSAVKQCALHYGIPIDQPEKLNDPKRFEGKNPPDVMVVVAYGLLLPEWVLQFPRLGCLNIHGSLLPRWRGAAPIQRAIEAGDCETGIGIMQMDKGLDTGAVWHEERLPILPTDTSATLHDKLATLGAKALLTTLPLVLNQSALPTPQAHENAVYAHKLRKEEAWLDWQQPADMLERKIRAFNPYPIAQSYLGEQIVRIHSATFVPSNHQESALGTVVRHDKSGIWVQAHGGLLALQAVQFPSKKIILAADLRNSHNLTGQQFTSAPLPTKESS